MPMNDPLAYIEDPELLRKVIARKRAEALMNAQMPEGQMVSGHYVAPSPLASLVATLRQGIGARRAAGADDAMAQAMARTGAIRRAEAGRAVQAADEKAALERQRLEYLENALKARGTWEQQRHDRTMSGQGLTERELGLREQDLRRQQEEFDRRMRLREEEAKNRSSTTERRLGLEGRRLKLRERSQGPAVDDLLEKYGVR